MKKIRLLAILLALVLVLVACTKDKETQKETEVEVTKETTGETASEVTPTEEVMTDLAKSIGLTYENYPKIDGSTSTLEIVQGLFDKMYIKDTQVYKEKYPNKASKTIPSYKKLVEGEIDMVIAPYPSKEVLDLAKEKGLELEFTKISGEALIFITPKENTVDNITRDQIRKIYLEMAIKNWSELGGPDKKLLPIARNADSGSQAQMNLFILDNEPMHDEILKNYLALTMDGIVEQVAFHHKATELGGDEDSLAIGYTLLTYLENLDSLTGVGEHIKILKYEGIEASRESIADGTYPLSDGYYVVTTNKLPQDHGARKLVEWLKTDEGSSFFWSLGLVPIKH